MNHPAVHVHIQIQAPDPIPKARPKGSIGKMTVDPPGEKDSAAAEGAHADANDSTKPEDGEQAWRAMPLQGRGGGGFKAWQRRATPPPDDDRSGGGDMAWWKVMPPQWQWGNQHIGGGCSSSNGSSDIVFMPAVPVPRPPPPAPLFHYIPPWATLCRLCSKETYIGRGWCMTPTCNMKKY